jgi:hypothetical protein
MAVVASFAPELSAEKGGRVTSYVSPGGLSGMGRSPA